MQLLGPQRPLFADGSCLCCRAEELDVIPDLAGRQARFAKAISDHTATLELSVQLLYFEDWLEEMIVLLLDEQVVVAWLEQCLS